MADLLAPPAPPAPPPLAPDERRKLLSAARRHRAAWLDDLCVGLAATLVLDVYFHPRHGETSDLQNVWSLKM